MTVAGYIYKQCRKAGFTVEASCALLAQIQKESGFVANNVEDGRGWSDEAYTQAVDNGTYDGFATDRIGYGIYQLTDPNRKQMYLNFTKIRGASIGDLDNQVQFMLWEMYKSFPRVWNMMTTLHDLKECTKILLYEWENPKEKEQNMIERYGYAQEWLKKANEMESTEKEQKSVSAIDKVLNLARAEIGYHEKANNAHLDSKEANSGSGNWTKYGRDLDSEKSFYNGSKNGYAWCDVFVDWLFFSCFGAETAMKMLCQPRNSAGAGCAYSAKYYKDAGRWTTKPQVGDQVFFIVGSEINHTGIVESVSDSQIVTIEGNSSGQVSRHIYEASIGYIAGYGRPRWELAKSETQEEVVTVTNNVNILQVGAKGNVVVEMQKRLIALGYDVGPDGADGEFGENTEAALKRYQRDNNLMEFGYMGPETFQLLKGVYVGKVASNTAFSANQVVKFKGTKQYKSAESDKAKDAKPGLARITRVQANATHPYYLVRILLGGSNIRGWADESDVEAVT